jgi:ribA/ribD-fused uncharacterized protein
VLDGLTYPTVEHAYQAAKTLDIENRCAIRDLDTPGKAKRMAWSFPLRLDWEQVKLDIMRDLVRQKFFSHKNLGRKLLSTGALPLIEGNTWGDHFWGVCRGKGENHLGQILMNVRKNLRGKKGHEGTNKRTSIRS